MNNFQPTDRQMLQLDSLRNSIASLGAAAVCFSGGVDSVLLLYVACEQLGDKVIAVTETNALYPRRETEQAIAFAKSLGVRHVLTHMDPDKMDFFKENPKNRCYLCKSCLFRRVKDAVDAEAKAMGLTLPEGGIPCLEGSNASDLLMYRPGHQAVKELGVLSPLEDAGLTKQYVRDISRYLALPTWDKPSFACLATRFAYGQPVTAQLLKRVDEAEQIFLDAGFRQVRVRMAEQGALARIEVARDRISDALDFLSCGGGSQKLHECGFIHVSLDVDGYRTGSMDE